jgi:hypothetical protein
MKFQKIYNKAAVFYIKEQQENEQPEPMQVSDEITSELPTPETIDLTEEKYKTLLLALKKALESAAGDDLEKRKVISNINVDTDPKSAEDQLISILNAESSEFPKSE